MFLKGAFIKVKVFAPTPPKKIRSKHWDCKPFLKSDPTSTPSSGQSGKKLSGLFRSDKRYYNNSGTTEQYFFLSLPVSLALSSPHTQTHMHAHAHMQTAG